MSRIRARRLISLVACSSWMLARGSVALAQPADGPPPERPAMPPTVAQVLSDGGWRSLTWYLLTREDREEVFVRDVGLDSPAAAALASYGGRALGEYEANHAKLKAEFCPRLAGVTTGSELGTAMREWTPRGEQELTRLLAGAFDVLNDADKRRFTRHLGALSRTTLFLGSDFFVDYEGMTPARVATTVSGACEPDA